MNNAIGLIILAAGEGKRMNSKTLNKVVLSVDGKPLISHVVERVEKIGASPIVVVIGYAKESVVAALSDKNVVFVEQKERLGTSHAAQTGLQRIGKEIENVMILNGDDAFFLTEEMLRKLIDTHISSNASVTMLTMILENPLGIGRVVRDPRHNILKVVEEKDATSEEKKIQEVNGIGYIFKRSFLETNLLKVKKSSITGEYYLTSLIELAANSTHKTASVALGKIPWRGVNTQEDLTIAKQLFKSESN